MHSRSSRIFTLALSLAMSFAALLPLSRASHAQGRLDLSHLKVASEAQSIPQILDGTSIFFKKAAALGKKDNVTAAEANEVAADGTNKKGDLVALRRDFESFITKLKQSDHWNAEFDAQFLAALRSTNAKNGVQQIGGARRLLEAVVGVAPDGANAWEFLARSDQDGMTITHYGYLTHISDLPDESLFSNPGIRTEVTARFTFSATTKLTARHLLGNIIATAAMGRLTIYFNPAPGADFTIPASFANGQPIATFSVRFQNILNVQSPDSGESIAVADLTQRQAHSFTLDGRNLRLGQHALRARLFATGQGTRTQVDPPKSSFLLGGNITVTKP